MLENTKNSKNRTRAEHQIVPLERAMAELIHTRKKDNKRTRNSS
jgi:hypothetical protein